MVPIAIGVIVVGNVDCSMGGIATVRYLGLLLMCPEIAPDISSAEVDQPLRTESRPDHYQRSLGGLHAGFLVMLG